MRSVYLCSDKKGRRVVVVQNYDLQPTSILCMRLSARYTVCMQSANPSSFPSLHVQGCFCAAGTVLLSENSSVCVTPSRCLEHCLPVLSLSVPIKVLARGADFCSTEGGRLTNFTRFLRRQIMRQYRANAGECRISNVQRTSCARKFPFIVATRSL